MKRAACRSTWRPGGCGEKGDPWLSNAETAVLKAYTINGTLEVCIGIGYDCTDRNSITRDNTIWAGERGENDMGKVYICRNAGHAEATYKYREIPEINNPVGVVVIAPVAQVVQHVNIPRSVSV